MGLLDRFKTAKRPESTPMGIDAQLREIQRALNDHELRMARVEGTVKGLGLEWSDYFDRFRRLYAKISKRAEREGGDGAPTDERPPARPTTPRTSADLYGPRRAG